MTANVNYVDAVTATHLLETEAGSAGGSQVRPVHGLPAGVVSDLAAVKTAVQALSAIIAGGKLAVADSTVAGYVDGLEALATSLNTYVDGLEGYVDGIETLLTAISGYVDGLEGFVDGLEGFTDNIETKLDTINTSIGAGGAGSVATTYQEQKTAIGTGSNVSFTTQALTRGMWIQNISDAGQKVYVAVTGTPSSTNGWWLYPGQAQWVDAANADDVLMRASASGAAVNMWGW